MMRGNAIALFTMTILLVLSIEARATNREQDQGQTGAAPQTDEEKKKAADAAIAKVRKDCGYSDTETDPKKINKQTECIARAVAAQRRKMFSENALRSTIDQAYGVAEQPPAGRPAPTATLAPGGNAGASSTGTSTTCGAGSGDNNPFIRVHRLLMAPKNASDDFGYRLGKRFIVYQVTISNDNKDFQYLIHDVSLDLSPLFFAERGTYRFAASSQDLTLLRGIPEKGQDLDRRNLILHILQGVGSVAAGVSGLSAYSDTMGPSVAVFNGPFLQSFIGIAPDHTGTQLNRLSDSAYITNTIIDKQRAKTIALFIPEATILSKGDQKKYWDDPYTFVQQVNLNQADVCVDGTFIAAVATPTLTSAVLTPKPPATALGPGVAATLTVQGTNLTPGDTQVFGLGASPITLSIATGTTGTVDVTLPPDYKDGAKVYLGSKSNPGLNSSTVVVSAAQPQVLAPTLATASLKSKNATDTLKPGVQATLTIQGTNLVANDTQVVGLGSTPIKITSVTGDVGTADVTLPADYKDGQKVHLGSASNSTLSSNEVAIGKGP
jgi:hypothetical protein